jgi:hypothetical protein
MAWKLARGSSNVHLAHAHLSGIKVPPSLLSRVPVEGKSLSTTLPWLVLGAMTMWLCTLQMIFTLILPLSCHHNPTVEEGAYLSRVERSEFMARLYQSWGRAFGFWLLGPVISKPVSLVTHG